MGDRPLQDPPLIPKSRESYVYFIQEWPRGNIKIGVAIDVEARLTLLQTGNSQELRVIGGIAGSYALERRIHDEFESAWVRGEWFKPTSELLFFIQRKMYEDSAAGLLVERLAADEDY